jgi:hypothetical protein
VSLLLVSTTSAPACSCAKGPQESVWHPTIPQAAAAILQHAKLNYGCVILEHHSLYCENEKNTFISGVDLYNDTRCHSAIEDENQFLIF